jgi:putative aldouronate transport system substrate-binding protein
MKKKLFYFLLLFFISAIIVLTGYIKNKPKLKTIKSFIDTILSLEAGREKFLAEYEKLTGIKLDIIHLPHAEYPEKVRQLFLKGDLPDIAEFDRWDYFKTADAGYLVALDDIIENSINAKSIDKRYYEPYRFKDGKIYGFPKDSGGGCVAYFRKDWLDRLGLKIPLEYNELYEVIKAFTEKDPDGNGKNDTVGYTFPMKVPSYDFDSYYRLIMQSAYFDFYKKNGIWTDGFNETEIKSAFERFKALYKEKLIDPDIFTNTTSACREKIYSGKAGIFEYWAGNWAKILNDETKKNIPQAAIIPIPPIKEAYYLSRIPECLAVTKKAKDPQAVFDNFIDFMWDKGKGQILFTYGVEGLHYKKNGEKFEMLPSPSNQIGRASCRERV